MSLERSTFDRSQNPFLRTANPFRINQQFHTQPASQQKNKKGLFSNHFYDSQCNHCTKNVPLLEEMNARSRLLKAEKQNLHKITSAKFKNGKLGSNPFEKTRLLGDNFANTNQAFTKYSLNDEGKLRILLQNNPFKKYAQQRKQIIEGKELEVQFQKVNLVKLMEKNSFEIQRREDVMKLEGLGHERKSSARFSIDSLSNSNKMKSIQIQSHPKSKFSPTIADIRSYRNSARNSTNEIPQTESKSPCLMMQISRSRKELFEQKNPQTQRQNGSCPTSQTKLPPKSPQKQKYVEHQNLQDPKVITVKGINFFFHQVKYRY